MICIHAPTEDKSEEEKDMFYDDLNKVYNKSPRRDIKLILGDMNAKVGTEEFYQPTIGRHSLHTVSNENGTRLINFASSRSMVIASTTFEHKNIHKITWKSPDGETHNQMDHLLVDSRHLSDVIDVRTYRGANVDSDHFLVIARIRSRISNRNIKNIDRKPQDLI